MLRDEVRRELQVYMSRTAFSHAEIAARTGYSRNSIRQFASGAPYGTSDGDEIARNLRAFMLNNAPPLPRAPARLYETEGIRKMDNLIAYAQRGGWGTCYGPAGVGKSLLFECRAAAAVAEAEPRIILVTADVGLSPLAFLSRIAAAISAPYAQYTEGIRRSVMYTIRKRRSNCALIVDEADRLYSRIDTLETLRSLGDRLRPKLGIIVAGNEDVEHLFDPRRRSYFEQWRSRIERRKLRVLGPSRAEARKMISGELGSVLESAANELLDDCTVFDAVVTKKHYISARRLFDTFDEIKEKRDSGRKVN